VRIVSSTLVVLAALGMAGLYLNVALRSLGYTHVLEWMEGGTLDVVQRVREQAPLYTAPSVDYVPYIYTPLYYYVVAALSSLLGLSFFTARLCSFACTVATLGVIYTLVTRDTQRRPLGLAAATLYLGSFEAVGCWFHLARVDSLYVLLLALVLLLVREQGSIARDVTCGVLMVCAVLTKQSALPVLGCVGVALAWSAPRRAALIGAVSLLGLSLCIVLLEKSSDGHFLFYAWQVPRGHPLASRNVLGFWTRDLLPAWPLLACSLVPLVSAHAGWPRRFAVASFVGLVGSAWMSRAHSGGAENTLMPAFLALSVHAPWGLRLLAERFAQEPARRRIAWPLVAALLWAQLFLLGAPSMRSVPTATDQRAAARFVSYLASVEGDVLMPDLRFVQTQANKRSYGLGMAAADVLRSRTVKKRVKQALRSSIRKAIVSRRFAQILLTGEDDLYFPLAKRHYCRVADVDLSPFPKVGARQRPRLAFVRPDDPRCQAKR
jgi:hypothetical protein